MRFVAVNGAIIILALEKVKVSEEGFWVHFFEITNMARIEMRLDIVKQSVRDYDIIKKANIVEIWTSREGSLPMVDGDHWGICEPRVQDIAEETYRGETDSEFFRIGITNKCAGTLDEIVRLKEDLLNRCDEYLRRFIKEG